MNIAAFALLALVPMMTGPIPTDERTLTMNLCNGGSITIPLGEEGEVPMGDCHQQGCHAGNCRKQFDLKQRLRGH